VLPTRSPASESGHWPAVDATPGPARRCCGWRTRSGATTRNWVSRRTDPAGDHLYFGGGKTPDSYRLGDRVDNSEADNRGHLPGRKVFWERGDGLQILRHCDGVFTLERDGVEIMPPGTFDEIN